MRCEVGAALALLLGGCSAVFGLDRPALDDGGHASDGTGIDALPTCIATGNFQVCVPAAIPGLLVFANDTTIKTDTPCPVLDTAHPTWCIYAAHDISISAPVRGTGAYPLVLVATGSLTITTKGYLDVSSHTAISPGSGVGAGGGKDPACNESGIGIPTSGGGGGGAGGTYGTAGGRGGSGGVAGASGGVPATVNPMQIVGSKLRGGCSGGLGGAGTVPPDPGGAGGGALYLAAVTTMRIEGLVDASGAGGGRGVASKGGGSGGGSGGMIALWAQTFEVTGEVYANGGGGGGGADNGASGSPGSESTGAMTTAPGGLGGGASACGAGPGCGGPGAIISMTGGAGYNDTTGAGGGGGGGGLGLIRIVSGQPQVDGRFSPAVTTN